MSADSHDIITNPAPPLSIVPLASLFHRGRWHWQRYRQVVTVMAKIGTRRPPRSGLCSIPDCTLTYAGLLLRQLHHPAHTIVLPSHMLASFAGCFMLQASTNPLPSRRPNFIVRQGLLRCPPPYPLEIYVCLPSSHRVQTHHNIIGRGRSFSWRGANKTKKSNTTIIIEQD